MRLTFILVFSLILLILFPGCELIEDLQNNQTQENDEITEEGEKGNNGETDKENHPEEVLIWLENMKQYFAAGDVKLDEGRYIIVNWGEKNTSGHELEISNIEETEEELAVTVSFEEPQESSAQVISYPNIVKKIENREKKIKFVPEGDEDFIPEVIGKQPLTPFLAESENIKIMEHKYNDTITIEGLARVFEANVNFALEDEEENVLKEDFTTAAMAAPHWSFFDFEIEEIPESAFYLTIYSTSMKDGSRQDEVRLQLDNL
ncbi:MAG: Gmad2 immunoglobulin-like domain-containing protein [Bacillota bacterium]